MSSTVVTLQLSRSAVWQSVTCGAMRADDAGGTARERAAPPWTRSVD
ncbi:MAG TPA: hypothetical protein VFL94_14755 [Actinomycetales bacterium]|nr:hypothetical protein [Actinomycetales bacterium]